MTRRTDAGQGRGWPARRGRSGRPDAGTQPATGRGRMARVAALALGAGVGMGLLFQACARVPAETQARLLAPAYPAWVRRGTLACGTGDQAALFGLGQVRGIRNVALARSTADNRARAELARLLERWFVAALTPPTRGKSAALLRPAAPGAAADDGQALRALLGVALPSVQVAEHWFHPDDGSIYALARLDVAAAIDAIGQLRELDAGVREALVVALPQAHAALCAEGARASRSYAPQESP